MRVTSNSYFDATVRNIQESYQDLLKLQNQVQTQRVMERPSDDPVRANQAILLETSLKEIQQFQQNIQSGSDLLTYSDQMLDNLMVPLNTAIEKVQQGLNAEQDATSRAAIASELEAIMDTFISIANTQLGDKSVFGGSDYLGEVFTRLGNNVVFNGNNDAFQVNVGRGESIQASLTAQDVFGASSTILDSERDLNPSLSAMSLDEGIPRDGSKELNPVAMKVQTRIAALQAFVKAGVAQNGVEYQALTTTWNAYSSTTFSSLGSFLDQVRDDTSVALGATSTTLTLAQSQQVKSVVDAVEAVYADQTNILTFTSGQGAEASSFRLSLDDNSLSSLSELVEAINTEALSRAGTDGVNLDNSNIAINARLNVLDAFMDARASVGLGDLGAFVTAVDAITVDATTTSGVYTKAVQDAAIGALGAASYNALTSEEKVQVDAATRAAKASFESVEFRAAMDRSGFIVRHSESTMISVDEAASSGRVVSALEMGHPDNVAVHVFTTDLGGAATLGGDRLITISNIDNDILNVQLREGDDLDTIALRINRAINQPGAPNELRRTVASVDKTGSSDQLIIQGNEHLNFVLDDNTEIANDTTKLYNGIQALYQSVDDLRGGSGIELGQQKLIADNVISGYTANLHVMSGDSLEYLMDQINGLEGFEVAMNSDGTGLDLTNVARYSVSILPTTPGNDELTILMDSAPGIPQTISFTGTTLSEMAREINSQSGLFGFKFHAEVSSDGTSLVISSNESFSLDSPDAAMVKTNLEVNDDSNIGFISSSLLTSLGFGEGMDENGLATGQRILGQQVELRDLNDGQGIEAGSIRVSVGITGADIDLSSATTVHDFKTLVEAALPGMVTVDLNDAGNGFSISSTGTEPVKIQELYGGATARTLGLIVPPHNSTEAMNIQGGDLNPRFSDETLLKDLNGGLGIESTGFTLTNGENSTIITLDSDNDGIDDIRTLRELVNHINQKSKQDDVYVEASIDPSPGGLKITSMLSNTALEVRENAADLPLYASSGIDGSNTDIFNMISLDSTKSVSVDLSTATDANSIAALFNAAANTNGVELSFRAVVTDNGTVSILSTEKLIISDTSTTYPSTQPTPTPSVTGQTASNLGLLGAFSETTMLDTLNNGSGVETGTFIVKWGNSGSESSATVDVEFAESLGDVKNAIEEATNGEVLVNFDRTNRLAFSLKSGDDNQVISFEEIAASQDVATQLGLIHGSTVSGRALRDGATNLLSSSTLLSELDLDIDGTSNNNLVFNTSEGDLTLDLTNALTMGDVVSIINSATQSDSGETVSIEAKIVNNQYLEVTDLLGNPLTAVASVTDPAASKLGLTPDPDLVGESVFFSTNLEPIHQAENFFSALTTLRDEFRSGGEIKHSLVSNTLSRLQALQNQLLENRGAAGGRITRMELLQTRYEDEALYVEGLYGDKTQVDILEVTQRYLQQQQVYEAGLSVASRILGTSLFSYI